MKRGRASDAADKPSDVDKTEVKGGADEAKAQPRASGDEGGAGKRGKRKSDATAEVETPAEEASRKRGGSAGGGAASSQGSGASQHEGGGSSQAQSQARGDVGSSGGKRDLTKGVAVSLSSFSEEDRKKYGSLVRRLKGRLIEGNDLEGCTHMVQMLPVIRTAKLCVGISNPNICIVKAEWIKACEMAKAFVSTDGYVLTGEHEFTSEDELKSWSFNATTSCKLAAEGGGFLSGRKLYATPNSIPKPDALKLIIEAAGGEMLSKSPSASSGEVIVLATEDDDRQWQALARHANVVVLHKIHFLNCGLRQKLDLVKGRLTL